MNRIEELKNVKTMENTNGGYVYILLAIDNTVKVGITVNPYKRIRNIETSSGKFISDWVLSSPCSNYRDIESSMHKKLKKFNLEGEWYEHSFEAIKQLLFKNYKFQECEERTAVENCRIELKSILLVREFKEFDYKEYRELQLNYNLDLWEETEEDIKFVTNELKEHIDYLKNEIKEDYKHLEAYLKDIEAGGLKRRKAIQNYYCCEVSECGGGYDDTLKEILESLGEYEIFKRILGVTEGFVNPIIDKWFDKVLNDLIEEYGKDNVINALKLINIE